MDNAETQRAAMGAGALLTEFGSHDDITDLARMTKLVDDRLGGWMYWAYKAWDDPTGNPAAEGLFAKDDDLATLKAPKADVLIRPYPQAIAGVPLALSWDATSKTMDLGSRRKQVPGSTDVFVPTRHYPSGYDAVVTGGHVVSSAAQARHLLVAANGAAEVHVVVRPHVAGPGTTKTVVAPSQPTPGGRLPATGLGLWLPPTALLILGICAALLKRRIALT